MNQPTMTITPRHYQALCGLALAAMFFLQRQQEVSIYLNGIMVIIGFVGIANIYAFSPITVLIGLAAGQLLDQYQQNGLFEPDFRMLRSLDVPNLLLCMATLAYLIGHYRLYGLRFGPLPFDKRQESRAQARSVESLTTAELASLVIPIPVCALLADFAAYVLKQHWTVIGLPPQWKQFLTIAWVLLIGMFVAAHAFRYWRRLQMDRAMALLLLQDLLWNETRGEQRRLNRWIVWKKLKTQEHQPEAPARN